MTPNIVGKENSEIFFSEKKVFFFALFVSTLVMMHDDPAQTHISPRGGPLLSCFLVGVRFI